MSTLVKRSSLLSIFYFVCLLDAFLGFISVFMAFNYGARDSFVQGIYVSTNFFLLLVIFFVAIHLCVYTYRYRFITFFLIFIFLSQFLYNLFVYVLTLREIDVFQLLYYLMSPYELGKDLPFYTNLIKFYSFIYLFFAVGSYLFLRRAGVITFISSFQMEIAVDKKVSPIGVLFKFVVLCAFFLLYVFFIGSSLIGQFVSLSGKGFYSLKNGALYFSMRTYQKNIHGKETYVYLYPTVHVATQDLYAYLNGHIQEDSLVLAEGVSDKNNLMKADIKGVYEKMALERGLVSQALYFPSSALSKNFRVHWLHADVDLADFNPTTLKFLNDVFEGFEKNGTSQNDLIASFSKDLGGDPRILLTVRQDIIVNRNAHVVNVLDENEAKYPRIVIPWGALHMRGIEKQLLERGYVLTHQEEVKVFDSHSMKAIPPTLKNKDK